MTYEKLLLLRWVKLSLLSELRDDTSMDELESCLGSMTDDPDKNPPSLTTPQIIFVITSFYFQVFRCIFCCLLFTVSRLTEQTKLSGKSPSLTTKREAVPASPLFFVREGLPDETAVLWGRNARSSTVNFSFQTARSSLLIEFQPQMIGYTKNKTEEDHWQSAARSLSKILTVVVGGETAGRTKVREPLKIWLGKKCVKSKESVFKFQIDEKICPLADGFE